MGAGTDPDACGHNMSPSWQADEVFCARGRLLETILCFIGIPSPDISGQRVAMRVAQGGHDVPTEKFISPFPRTLSNLQSAIRELPHVRVFDNGEPR